MDFDKINVAGQIMSVRECRLREGLRGKQDSGHVSALVKVWYFILIIIGFWFFLVLIKSCWFLKEMKEWTQRNTFNIFSHVAILT